MKRCYKCGVETIYSVEGTWASHSFGDSKISVCEHHLLEGALKAYKIALEISPRTPWVLIEREMTKEEILQAKERDRERAQYVDKIIETPYVMVAEELTDRANAIIRQYRIKHGTLVEQLSS